MYVFTKAPQEEDAPKVKFYTGLNKEFSFPLMSCHIKAKEPNLLFSFSVAGGRVDGFIPFPRILTRREISNASSRIRTYVAVSISNHDIYYTTSISQESLSSKLILAFLARHSVQI